MPIEDLQQTQDFYEHLLRIAMAAGASSDEWLPCITGETNSVWFVLFAPADYPETSLNTGLRRAEAILRRYPGV